MRPAASVGEIFAVDSFNPDMRKNLLILTYLFFVKKLKYFDMFRDLIYSEIKTNLGFSFFGQKMDLTWMTTQLSNGRNTFPKLDVTYVKVHIYLCKI